MNWFAMEIRRGASRSLTDIHVRKMADVLAGASETELVTRRFQAGNFASIVSYEANDSTISAFFSGTTHTVFSGMLANASDLKSQLGLPIASSNSEIVARAWRAWGADCIARLYGAFRLVIVDANKVLVAVDHLAQCPVYYHMSEDLIYVSSLPHAIAAVEAVTTSLNRMQLARYILPCFLSQEETFFRDIFAVPPATVVSFGDDSTLHKQVYWHPQEIGCEGIDPNYKDHFRELVNQSVGSMVSRSESPIGLLMSGGIDSSILSYECSSLLSHRDKSNAIAAVCSVREDRTYETQDDAFYADILARNLGIKLSCISKPEFSFEMVDTYFASSGQPPENMDYPMRYTLMRHLSEMGAKVVLSGEGGEVTASSYGRGMLSEFAMSFRWMKLAETFRSELKTGSALSKLLWETIYPFVPGIALEAIGIRKSFVPISDLAHNHFLHPDFVEEMYSSGLDKEIDSAIDYPNRWFPRDPRTVRENDVENLRLLPVAHVHGGLPLGIETKCPFYDRKLIEFAFSLCPTVRRTDGANRRLARDTYEGRLPEKITSRKSKSPYFPGYANWLNLNEALIESSVQSVCYPFHLSSSFQQTDPTRNEVQLHQMHRTAVAARFAAWTRDFLKSNETDKFRGH